MKIIKTQKIKKVKIFKRNRNFQPENWSVVPLKSICNLINGMAFKPSDWSEDGLKIVRIQNLNGSNTFNFYNKEDYKEKNVILNNDLLFAWSGSIGTSFGPYLWSGEKALLNQHIFKVEMVSPYNNEVYKKWFYFYLKDIEKRVEEDAHGGGGLVHVKKGTMENYNISLPTTDEIENIATVLSQQEEQINNIQKLIEKLEKRNQYYTERLLSGELRVREDDNNLLKIYKNESWKEVSSKINKSGNILSPQDWSLIKLENIFISSVGGEYGKELNNLNQDLKTKVITLHVFSGKDTEKSVIDRAIDSNKLKNRLISSGDIVIEKSGGTENCSVGRVYLAENINEPTTSVNFTNILKIDSENYDSKYIYELLKFFHLRRIAAKYEQKTVGIANLKQSEYFKLKYIFPKKEEQVLISKFIKQLDLSIFEMKKLLEKEQKRFEWLSDALLSGEYQIVD